MAETELVMLAEFRDEVLDRKRNNAFRPGHRAYKEGPAVIRFIRQASEGQVPDWANVPPVHVIITKVEHTEASGKHAIFADFMGLGQEITLLEWELA